MYNLPTLLKGLALSIYKFGFKFTILLLFSILFLGCFSHQPQRSNSVLFSFITPDFRISDAGFIHHYANESQIQIYSSGAVILNLKLAQNICINSVCYNRQIFNTKYLKSTHYDEIMDDIISKRPIYDSNTLKQTSCGFEQNIINKMIKYEVCDNVIKFIDNKNRVKIIIRELQ